jgi:hypothetical protein
MLKLSETVMEGNRLAISVRPHHFLAQVLHPDDFVGYTGRHSDAIVDFTRGLSRLSPETPVEFVFDTGTDPVCLACPRNPQKISMSDEETEGLWGDYKNGRIEIIDLPCTDVNRQLDQSVMEVLKRHFGERVFTVGDMLNNTLWTEQIKRESPLRKV